MKNKEPHRIEAEQTDSMAVKALRAIVTRITKANEWVYTACSCTLALLLAVMVIEVFRRYVLKSPSIWGFDFSLWIFGMPALLSGGYLIANKSHVNMDMLYNRCSPRGKAILDCITAAATFAFLWIMFTQCWKAAGLAITRNEMSITTWSVKIWPVKIWMPIAAGLSILQAIGEFIKNLYLAITGRGLMK